MMLTKSPAAIATVLLVGQHTMNARAISKQKAEFMQKIAISSANRKKSARSGKLSLKSSQDDVHGPSALRDKVIEKSKYIASLNEERVLQNYDNSNKKNGDNNAYNKNYNYNAGANKRNR